MVETSQEAEDFLSLIQSKLISVKSNLASENYRECVSALFYISEAMVKYVLATKGYFPISHEGTQVLLAQHFVKSGVIKKNVYNYLTNLYMRRKDADYKGFVSFDLEDVRTYWGWVVEIFNELKGFFETSHALEIEDSLDEVSRSLKQSFRLSESDESEDSI
jgi:uncharacterized protein (UPF0332 family)